MDWEACVICGVKFGGLKCWIPIHICDIKTLPGDFKAEFSKFWVVRETTNKFSSIPIDQCHEQNNAIAKREGGMIGLTESPTTFRKWAIAAPEQSHLIKEFEHFSRYGGNREYRSS